MNHDTDLAPGGASPEPTPAPHRPDHDGGPPCRTCMVEHLGCPCILEPGASLPPEPLADTCHEPSHVAERTLRPDDVLVLDPRTGLWALADRGTLEAEATWWADGALHHGDRLLGHVPPEALHLAGVPFDEALHHDAPCATEWVLRLDDGPAHPQRLHDVPEGARVAFAGRVLRVGDGRVQPTGEVLARVVDTFDRVADGVVDLEVLLPDGELTWLSATAEHPFYSPDAGRYVSVRHLDMGARLHVQGGSEAILVGKTWRQGGVEVFNVEVAGAHSYFAAGVLTHNAKRRCEPDPDAPACDVLTGTLRREFPSQYMEYSLNEITEMLGSARGKEKKTLQKAKKLLQQGCRLMGKLK